MALVSVVPPSGGTTLERTNCPRKVARTLDTDAIIFQKVLEIEPLTPGFAILEGPLWVDDALLLSHIGYQTDENASPADLAVFRNGTFTVLQAGYGANGLTMDDRGFVVAARQKDGSVTRVINGRRLIDTFDGARFNSPNDLVFSSRGDLYFTDPDYQAPAIKPQTAERVYALTRKDQVQTFGANIQKPNGIMLSLDERSLFVGGVNGLFKFRVRRNGKVVDAPIPVAASEVTGGVDGMSKDCAGNLYVAADGALVVINVKRDRVLAQYPIEGITNVAFGGADGRTIFVTTLGETPQVWQARSNIPGFPF